RQNDNRGNTVTRDPRTRLDPVHHRHLHIKDHKIRAKLLGQLHSLPAITSLPRNLIALLLQHLLQIEADKRLILGNQHPARGRGGLAHRSDSWRKGAAHGQIYYRYMTAPGRKVAPDHTGLRSLLGGAGRGGGTADTDASKASARKGVQV